LCESEVVTYVQKIYNTFIFYLLEIFKHMKHHRTYAMRTIFTLLLGIGIAYTGMGQLLSGKVTDPQGNPLAFASVYVKHSTYGVATDAKGRYFIELKEGMDTLVYSYLGYDSKEWVLPESPPSTLHKDITLLANSLQLEQVEVIGDTRSFARAIMKKVRRSKSKYRRNIRDYSCNTYFKTSLEKKLREFTSRDSIKLAKDTSGEKFKDLRTYLQKQNVNLIESHAVTYFKQPDKYKSVILAQHDYSENVKQKQGIQVYFSEFSIVPVQFSTNNPYLLYTGEEDTRMDFYRNYVYLPNVTSLPLLSPAASSAPLSYDFDLEETFYEKGKKVYKIKVIPRFKGDALFSGWIFIEDERFAIRSVDLSINPNALKIGKEFRIIQNYTSIQEGIYLPVRREIYYTIPTGRYDIIGNSRIIHDSYRVNTGLPGVKFDNELLHYDKEAFDKSETYWDSIRPITLLQPELKFIHKTDSLKAYFNSEEYLSLQDSIYNNWGIWDLLLNGFGYQNSVRGRKLSITPLIAQIRPFGVGGYRHALGVRYSFRLPNEDRLETETEVSYGVLNRDLKAKIGVGWTYLPARFMRTFVRVGDMYEMVNTYESFEALLSPANYVRSRMISVEQRMELINGLFGALTLRYSLQDPITDIMQPLWMKETFGDLSLPKDFKSYTKAEAILRLTYLPFQRYIMKGRRKIILPTSWPEFSFIWRKGIPDFFRSEVNFDYIELGARQHKKLLRLGYLNWRVEAGRFVNARSLRLLEHRFFRGSDLFYFSNPIESFQTLGPTFHTENAFIRGHFVHHFQGALLNKIPLVRYLKLGLAGGASVLYLEDNNYRNTEFFAGLERHFTMKGQLFRFGFWTVAAADNDGVKALRYKLGIDYYNAFTHRWSY